MTITQIDLSAQAATPTPPPSALEPRTLGEDLIAIVRETEKALVERLSHSAFKRKPGLSFELLAQIFCPRSEMIKTAAARSEKPALWGFFSELLAVKNLHEVKGKASLKATGKKTFKASPTTKDFLIYWDKINPGNELERLGALYLLESVIRSGREVELAIPALKTFPWAPADVDRELAHLDAIFTEFSSLSSERILAGARQAARYLVELFSRGV